jgi:signal peptidase I
MLVLVLLVLLVLPVVMVSATFIMVTVRGGSMTPTLHPGDRVLVLRRWAGRGSRRHDVVIARPALPGGRRLWIKRVHAVAGDRVTSLDRVTGLDKEFVLSDGEVFLVGDHEAGSFDSRQYGAVSTDDIVGRVVHHFPSRHGTPAPAINIG